MMRSRKYAKALLWIFLGSVGFGGLLWGIRTDFWSGLQFGFLFGLGLVLFVGLVVLPVDFLSTRNLSSRELDVTHHAELELQGNVVDVFQAAVEVLSNLSMIRDTLLDQKGMMITARTKLSWASFGEKITLQFIGTEKEGVKVRISSEPVFKKTILDYGKNLKNVRSIGKAITERLRTSVGEGKETG